MADKATAPKGTGPRVRVDPADGRFRLVATAPIRAGETILEAEGCRVAQPSRYSLQIGDHEHLEAPVQASLEELVQRHPWRFLNHSCEPNSTFVGCTLRAIGAIRSGEEITFDYNTTEYAMSWPFTCECGSTSCIGEVRGFRHLSPAARRRLLPYLAEHLRRCIDANGHGVPPAENARG